MESCNDLALGGRNMFKRISVLLCMILTSAVVSISCGGGSSGPKVYDDGRVFLKNELQAYPSDPTLHVVTSRYFHEELGQQIEVKVPPGESKDISTVVLKGGTEVLFYLVARTGGSDPLADVKVKIDGNVMVRVTKALSHGANVLEYVVQSG